MVVSVDFSGVSVAVCPAEASVEASVVVSWAPAVAGISSDADVMTIVTATPKAVRKFIKGILLLHNLVKAQRNRLSAHGL